MQLSYWVEMDVATHVDCRGVGAITSSTGCDNSFLPSLGQQLYEEPVFQFFVCLFCFFKTIHTAS